MSDLTRKLRRPARRRARRRRDLVGGAHPGPPRPDRRGRRRRPRVPARRPRGRARAGPRRPTPAGPPAPPPRRSTASRSRSRTCSPPRACPPPAARGSSRAGCRRTTRPSSSGSAPPAPPILGKTNMDEFAMGSSTEHSAYGPTHNPWDLDRIPGGSGGGSAAAVAAFEAPLAIGTDTGGSIRQPGAVTGTVGVKPTYGGVSRYGLVALATSLDQAGPVTRTVLDSALLHEVIGGHDPRDSTSIDQPLPAARRGRPPRRDRRHEGRAHRRRQGADRRGLPGRRAGPLRRGRAAARRRRCRGRRGLLPDVRVRAGRLLPDPADRGVEQPREVRRDALRPAGRPDGVEAPSAEEVMRATRDRGFGDEVKRRIILGTYALSSGYYDAYYGQAQKVRTLITRDFEAAFEQVDVLVSPTTPTTAFKLGEKLDDPLAMYLNDLATIPANLAGVPGISVPSGLADRGRPAGRLPGAGAGAGRRPGLPGRRRARGAARRPVGRAAAGQGPRAERRSLAHERRSHGWMARLRRGARDVRPGARPRGARRAQHRLEDVLRLPDRVRRRAQHPDLPGLPRPARVRCRWSTARRSSRRSGSAWR